MLKFLVKYYLNKIKKINLNNIKISMLIDVFVVIIFISIGIFNIFFNQEKVSPILLGISQLALAFCFFLMMLSKRLDEKNQQLIQELFNLLDERTKDKAILVEVLERLSLQIRSRRRNGTVN